MGIQRVFTQLRMCASLGSRGESLACTRCAWLSSDVFVPCDVIYSMACTCSEGHVGLEWLCCAEILLPASDDVPWEHPQASGAPSVLGGGAVARNCSMLCLIHELLCMCMGDLHFCSSPEQIRFQVGCCKLDCCRCADESFVLQTLYGCPSGHRCPLRANEWRILYIHCCAHM
jgi:hypothetical protein